MYEAGQKIEKWQQTAADAVEQLVQSKNTAQNFAEDLKQNLEDTSERKSTLKSVDSITKRLEEHIALFLGKVDDRQGITRNRKNTVMSRLGTASSYVQSRQSGITKTEEILMEQAREELQEALNKTNKFYRDVWPDFKEEMNQIEMSAFKETKIF